MSGASLEAKATIDPLIHKAYLEELADAYAPAPLDRKDPRISPLFSDLRGFPPTIIQVGSSETLIDDSVRFARALGLADVDVTLQVWPHMIHAWAMWNARLTEGREALEQAGEFIRRQVHS
jgi:acetyl esterase/lipase